MDLMVPVGIEPTAVPVVLTVLLQEGRLGCLEVRRIIADAGG